MGAQPGAPAEHEGTALALAGEDAVEVAAMDAQLARGDGRAGEADARAMGLVRSGWHYRLLRCLGLALERCRGRLCPLF